MHNPFTAFTVTDDWQAHIDRNAFGGGIDWAMPVGTPLPAPNDASMSVIYNNGTGGNTVIFNYPDGSSDYYMHLSEIDVAAGQQVNEGDIVGLSGGEKGAPGAGNSTGPHLHAHGINAQGVRVPPFHGVTAAAEEIKPIEQEEYDMKIVLGPMGNWLVGANYAHNLTPGEAGQVVGDGKTRKPSYPVEDFGNGKYSALAQKKFINAHKPGTFPEAT